MYKWLAAPLLLLGLATPAHADSTIAAMTAASTLDGTETLYCVQSSADRKCTVSQWATYLRALTNTWSGANTFTNANGITITNTKGWQLMQSPSGGSGSPVPAFYPVDNNMGIAVQIIPHGTATDYGWGIARFNGCNADFVANISVAYNCFNTGVSASEVFFDSTNYNSALAVPLNIGIMNGDTGSRSVSATVNTDSVWQEANGVAGKMRSVTASGTITATAADHFICVNKTTGAATAVNLWGSPRIGSEVIVMDCKGDATTNHITISPAVGNIDGASTLVIGTNWGSSRLIYTGTIWKTW